MRGFKNKILVVGVLILFSTFGKAQITDVNELSPFQLKRFAKSAERGNDAFTAIFYYEKYKALKPNNSEINYHLPDLHRKVRNYNQAADLYKQVSKAFKRYTGKIASPHSLRHYIESWIMPS